MIIFNIQETDDKFENDEAEESREKIHKLEERLEFLNKEFEFTKQREVQYRNKVQQVEEQKTDLQKELNSAKYELQKQITRAEKAEEMILEKTEDLKSKNVIIKTMAEEIKQIKMDLQRSQEEIKRYCFKLVFIGLKYFSFYVFFILLFFVHVR